MESAQALKWNRPSFRQIPALPLSSCVNLGQFVFSTGWWWSMVGEGSRVILGCTVFNFANEKWSVSHSVTSKPCNCVDCSPPGLPVHGMLQVRILEWIVTSFSRGSSRPRDRTRVSCITGRFFTIWAPWEALNFANLYVKIFTLCPVLYCFLEEMFQKYFVRKNLCRFFEGWLSDYHQNVEVEKEVILAFFSWQDVLGCNLSPVPGFQTQDESLEYLCHAVSREDGSFSFFSLPSGGYTVVSKAAFPSAYVWESYDSQSALGMSKDGTVGLQLHRHFI